MSSILIRDEAAQERYFLASQWQLARWRFFKHKMAVIALVILAAWGQFGTRHLLGVALLVPGQLLGYLVSGRLVRVLDRGYTRPALLIISVAAALSLLVRALI